MRGGRGLVGLVVLALVAALAAVAADAAKKPKPVVRAKAVTGSQRTILKSRRVKVDVAARKVTHARLFASFRSSARRSPSRVITKLTEVKLRPAHQRRVSLKLNRAGLRELRTCTSGKVTIVAVRIAERAGPPIGKPVRTSKRLRRDAAGCRAGGSSAGGSPGGGSGGGGSGGGGSGGGGSGGGGSGGGRGSQQPVDYTPENPDRCDWIDGADCLFPFPNDHFTTADSTTDTKRRLNLNILSMPRNRGEKPIDPAALNRNDGFSPGQPIVTKVSGLETPAAFDRSRIVPIDDMADAFRPSQPVVVIDTVTRARHPVWAEVDVNPLGREPPRPQDVTLIIRPSRNFLEGRRYVVAMRNLREATGKELTPALPFRIYRDGIPTGDEDVEARRPRFESMFGTLAEAGIERDDLYRAWDFTVASERNLTERILTMRDTSFAELGDTNLADLKVAGSAPSFEVTKTEDNPDGETLRRVEGNFTVPCWLNLPGCPVGSSFAYTPGSTHGPPARLPGNTMQAHFRCNIPKSATSGPSRPSLYGHGLFGDRGEVEAGNVRAMGNEHNFVFCATDWIGMACADVPGLNYDPEELVTGILAGQQPNSPNCDVPNALSIETDLSRFPELVDRVQQGMLNFLYLGRLMVNAGGFNSDPAFQVGGRGAIDTARLFYDGNSQGGIIGGALMAVMVDAERGVLGVPGMAYSTLLQRSIDFGTGQPPQPDPTDPESFLPEYAYALYESYPNELQRQLILSLMQTLWDRGEANGYALHMTSDPPKNTPAHNVLLHVALGDHQVAQLTAESEARTIGASARAPWTDPGRDLDRGDPVFGVPTIGSYPFGGSAIVLWDTGPKRTLPNGTVQGTAPPPNTNTPPTDGRDPHSAPRAMVSARQQKSAFLKIGGQVIDVCGARPCYAGGWAGP